MGDTSILEGTLFHSGGCSCYGCAGGYTEPGYDTQNDINDPITTYAPSVTWTKEDFSSYLSQGFWQARGGSERQWAGDTPNVTYNISSEYTANDAQGIRAAFSLWAEMADITFSEVSSGADIRILEHDGSMTANSSYYTFPGSGDIVSDTYSGATHTINVNMYVDNGGQTVWTSQTAYAYFGSYGTYGTSMNEYGNYAKMTIIHEIGHSLGLGHTGNYNGSGGYSGDATAYNDTRQYSVMSYFDESNYGGANFSYYNPSTPMLMDIYAIQQKYGANMATRTGNSTYGFNSNLGGVYDFNNHAGIPVIAIWDAGGTDTLDFSGYSTNQLLNLNESSFSNAGAGTGNIAIAYGATIENAIGGSGNDSIYGNTANNVISGGNGTDTIYGSIGSDTLDGGEGSDTVTYSYDISDFLILLVNSVTLSLQHIAQAWTDTVANFENFIFNGASYTWEEVQGEVTNLDPMKIRVNWGGGAYVGNFDNGDDYTLTAAQMGYGGASGNLVRVQRDVNDMTISILSNDLPGTFFSYGTSSDDTITFQGSHTNFGARIYAGNGADTIVMFLNSADRIYGEAGDDIISAGDGDDYVYGGTGDDTVSGGAGGDTIYGMEDNDILNGNAGNDVIYGGAGNDTIDGGSEDDMLYGEAGADTISGGNGNDWIEGGDGIDILNGGSGNDRIYGGADGDTINGDGGTDYLYGDAGNDTINGGDAADYIYGMGDDDIINGDAGDDILFGNDGNDTINGGMGFDKLYGGTGNDTMNGNENNDYLYGEDGDDILYGGAGVDRIYGDAGSASVDGNDTLYGDDGNDYLYGNGGNDTLYGGNDNDILYGNAGNDRLEGQAGNDTLYGNEGSDILIGDAGADILEGGAGSDVFGFTSVDGSRDLIADFTINGAEKDAINLTDLLSGFIQGVSDINDFVGLAYYHGNRTELYVNADGVGNDWVNIAKIQGSSFAGVTVDDLVNNGNLITNQTLL